MGGCEEDEARFFTEVFSDKKKRNVYKPKCRKFHLNIRKGFFYCEGGWTLEQDHREWKDFRLGDIQHPNRHGPEQPALTDSALSNGGGLNDLQRCHATSSILCVPSVFSINNTGRTGVTVRTGIYILVLFISQTLTVHTRKKFCIEHFFFRMYKFVEVNLFEGM